MKASELAIEARGDASVLVWRNEVLERFDDAGAAQLRCEQLRAQIDARVFMQDMPVIVGETDGHTHVIAPWSNETTVSEGHSHLVLRDEYGRPIQVAEADGHTHEIEGAMDIDVFAEDGGNVLRDVEIFRVGTWNGRKFTEDDLDDMIAAYSRQGFRAPVKLGHDEASGDRAWGWVDNLRKVGDRLIADFVDIADAVFETIKEHGYDAVSSEIYFNLKRGEDTFRRALKAVALLGAETPAVSDLKPLRESLAVLTYEGVAHLQLSKEHDDMSDEKITAEELENLRQQAAEAETLRQKIAESEKQGRKSDSADALKVAELTETIAQLKADHAAEIDKRRRERISSRVENFPIPALREHFKAMLDLASQSTETVKFTVDDETKDLDPEAIVLDLMGRLDKHTSKLFSQLSTTGDLDRDDQPTTGDAGAELHKLTLDYQAKHDGADYNAAFTAVKNDPKNAELVRRYTNRSEG